MAERWREHATGKCFWLTPHGIVQSRHRPDDAIAKFQCVIETGRPSEPEIAGTLTDLMGEGWQQRVKGAE